MDFFELYKDLRLMRCSTFKLATTKQQCHLQQRLKSKQKEIVSLFNCHPSSSGTRLTSGLMVLLNSKTVVYGLKVIQKCCIKTFITLSQVKCLACISCWRRRWTCCCFFLTTPSIDVQCGFSGMMCHLQYCYRNNYLIEKFNASRFHFERHV